MAQENLADKAQNWIENHYLEKFSLTALAADLYVNKNYLLRVFKAAKGTTLLQYHNRVRCRHADEFLCRPNLSISYIGNSVGFKTTSHFIKVYKQITGVTPETHRRQYFETLQS